MTKRGLRKKIPRRNTFSVDMSEGVTGERGLQRADESSSQQQLQKLDSSVYSSNSSN